MFERSTLRTGFVTSLLVLSLGLSACSNDDDDDDSGGTTDPVVDDATGDGNGVGAGNDTGNGADGGTDNGGDTGNGTDGGTDNGDDTDNGTDGGTDNGDDTDNGTDGGTDNGDDTDNGTDGGTDNGDDTDNGTDGGTDTGNNDDSAEVEQTVALTLDGASTVPPAQMADGASGTGDITVDTETGAISGSVAVSGTSDTPTMAHVHQGAVGEAGPVLITMVPNDDGTVWSMPENAALDAAGIQAFLDGNLYINVHTEANPAGELRAQLTGSGADAASGNVTVSFMNLSESQIMTPPVVIVHNSPDSDNGIRYFKLGNVVSEEVELIAEGGDTTPLLEAASGQITNGRVNSVALAMPEAGGPLTPGASASVTVSALPGQVMSIVTMVVCSNDGFTGVDSIEIVDGTFTTPVYDAGSETNVETLDWWVPPCGSETNNTDDENGLITLHPGQANAEDPAFNFPAESELLEISISVN